MIAGPPGIVNRLTKQPTTRFAFAAKPQQLSCWGYRPQNRPTPAPHPPRRIKAGKQLPGKTRIGARPIGKPGILASATRATSGGKTILLPALRPLRPTGIRALTSKRSLPAKSQRNRKAKRSRQQLQFLCLLRRQAAPFQLLPEKRHRNASSRSLNGLLRHLTSHLQTRLLRPS